MAPHFFIQRSQLIALIVIALSLITSSKSYAQAEGSSKSFDTYLIIGAFTVESNANRLIDLVEKLDFRGEYRKNENRGLYYVFIDQSNNRDQIKERVLELRAKYPQFYDAWAYTGDFTDPKIVVAKPAKGELKSTAEKVENNTSKNPTEDTRQDNQEIGEDAPTTANSKTKNEATSKENPEPVELKEDHYYFYFNAINAKNLKEVKGNVNIIDVERAKQLKEAKSHELVELKDPDNGTQRVKVASNMFGFREVQYTLDLDDSTSLASNSAVRLKGDTILVDFELKRFKKGDILIMYNVYFFKDAAIMKPESIYELNALLDMIKENDNLVVKIHGHTNGNSHGKIIHLDLEDKNFFGINGEHKESRGSAKKLSLYRAYTIQHWLMEQGISEDRMEIKGWGGKKMLYDKFDPQADQNVRVEIEILEE